MLVPDILKEFFFLRGQNFSFEILHEKKCKNSIKNHLLCVKHEEEKMQKRLKCINFQLAHANLNILRKVRKFLRGCTTV